MLRAALFAFHDVLVDDAPLHRECLERALTEEGISLSPSAYQEHYPGGDPKVALAALLEVAGLPPSPIRQIRLEARESTYYQERVRTEGPPFRAGVLDLVQALAAAEWTLGVVGAVPRQEIERALQQAGARERFKVIVAAEDLGLPKLQPESYVAALNALNALPPLPERLFHAHEVLVVEASPEGLEAAAAAGCPTLALARRPQVGPLEADWVVEGLAGLTPERLRERFAEASRR